MKKIFALAFVIMMLPTLSFADYATGKVTLGSTDTLDVATSNQVHLNYADGTTGDGDTFVIATYHDKGTRSYMSSSEDANIYWADATAATLPAAPAIGTSVGEAGDFTNTL